MWPSYRWEFIFFPSSVSQTWCKGRAKPSKAGAGGFQVCDVKGLNPKAIAVTGALQMFVLSLKFPSPLTLHFIINGDFLKINSFIPANILQFSSVKTKQSKKKRVGQRDKDNYG